MTGFARFIPLAVILALVVLFFAMMGGARNPQEIKSVLVGKPVPSFSLPVLSSGETMTESVLLTGEPVLVNFFASWCAPCRAEHASLMKLSNEYGLRIVGIAYKDDLEKSRAFLRELGNPYDMVVVDQKGRTAIDWGVTGVPETFLISKKGLIVYRHWGPVVGADLETRLMPKVREAFQ